MKPGLGGSDGSPTAGSSGKLRNPQRRYTDRMARDTELDRFRVFVRTDFRTGQSMMNNFLPQFTREIQEVMEGLSAQRS